MITEETIARVKSSLQATKSFTALEVIEELEKENEQWKQEWQDAQIKANEEGFARTTLQIKCTNLEKENAELREYAKFLQDTYCGIDREIAEIKKENEQLNRDKTELDNSVTELKIKVTELEKQIEKMKCCYNCSKWNDGQCKDIKDSFFYVMADFNCDKWELAE